MPRTVVNNYGPSGPATIKVTPKVIEVKMDGNKYLEPFRFDRASYKGVVVAGHGYARISSDTEVLYGLRPLTGNYFVKFKEFSHKKEEAPLPRTMKERVGVTNGKPWKIEEHIEFTALVTITQGEWEGAELPINLWYHFREYQSTGLTEQIIGRSKSKVLLDNFLINGGIDMDTDTLPWSENVLPELQARLKKASAEFLVNLNAKGYIETISPAPSMGSPKKKKAAKK
jgi:hypothetical protein